MTDYIIDFGRAILGPPRRQGYCRLLRHRHIAGLGMTAFECLIDGHRAMVGISDELMADECFVSDPWSILRSAAGMR